MLGVSIRRRAIITRQSPVARLIYSIFYRMVPSNLLEDESVTDLQDGPADKKGGGKNERSRIRKWQCGHLFC